MAMGGGILLYFSLPAEPPLWLGALTPLCVVAAFLAARWHSHLGWGIGLVAAAMLGFTAALLHAARQPPPLLLPRQAVVLSGVVSDVDLLPEGVRVTLVQVRLSPDSPPLARSLRIRLRQDDPLRPVPGDQLRLRALIRPPSPPAWPGAWDFQRAAFFTGEGGAGFALSRAERVAHAAAASLFASWRLRIETRIAEILPGTAGAIAAALLTGSRSAIPKADLTALRDAGLAHLLAVSGLHMAIVMGVTFAAVRLLIACWRWLALRIEGKVVAGFFALGAGGFYLLLTAAQVPVQRAFAMAAVVVLAMLLGRRALSLRNLALAAAMVMAMAPASLLGPSFQMSFAAVLALIAGWEALRQPLRRWREQEGWPFRMLLPLGGLVITSLLAALATAPVGLAHFGRLQWYAVAANVVAVPLTSIVVMPAGMLALLLMPVGAEAPALRLMGLGVQGVLAVAHEVAAWPGAAQVARPLPPYGLALYGLGLCWLCLWRSGWRWFGVPLILSALVSARLAPLPDVVIAADGRLIGIVERDRLWLERRPGASNFIRDQWLRGFGLTVAVPLPREGEGGAGIVHCEPALCRLRKHGQELAIVRRERGAEAVCGRVALVIATEPLRGRCRGSRLIDRFTLWREGAHAVWLGPEGVRILSDRAWRGARPWVPPLPSPRPPRQAEDLIAAPSE